MTDTVNPSQIRLGAKASYEAEWLTTNDHTRLELKAEGDFIKKPIDNLKQATHLQMQAEVQKIRYTIDGTTASDILGYTLAVGAIATIPVPNLGVSVFPIASGAVAQYQWIR